MKIFKHLLYISCLTLSTKLFATRFIIENQTPKYVIVKIYHQKTVYDPIKIFKTVTLPANWKKRIDLPTGGAYSATYQIGNTSVLPINSDDFKIAFIRGVLTVPPQSAPITPPAPAKTNTQQSIAS